MKKKDFAIECRPFNTDHTYFVNLYESFPEMLDIRQPDDKKNLLFIVDRNVKWFMEQLIKKDYFKDSNISAIYLDVPPKNLDNLIAIWTALIQNKPDTAVGVGGGTICDLTGLAASTYRRGIPFILFPTTLLAVADASISGKTGIDFNGVKNSIGSIHYPSAVFGIMEAFSTLPGDEFRSGLSEIVKVAVTCDASFFDGLEEIAAVPAPGHPDLLPVIKSSCRLKAGIVGGDAMIRLHSLYGHVIGQAIEALDMEKRRHGDCVSIGMHAEGYIAWKMGLWTERDWRRQAKVLEAFRLPLRIPADIEFIDLMQQVQKDKHASARVVNLILPHGIGNVHTTGGNPLTAVSLKQVTAYIKNCPI